MSITVVVPTRDRWDVVSRTIRSALAQEEVEVEVVVVDDGSVDEAPGALPGLADGRVQLVRHTQPLGAGAARNAGIRAGRGEWIAFLDDDDLWSPQKLRLQLDAAERVGAGLAYAGVVWVDERLALLHGHAPPPPGTLARELLRWNVLWGGASNVVARRDLLESIGGFDEELHQLADWDLWIRLAQAAPAAVADDVLVALVVHEQSMLLVDRRDVFLELDRLAAKHQRAAVAEGTSVDRARFSRWVAAGHQRAGRRRAAAGAYLRGNRALGNLLRAAVSPLGSTVFSAASALREAVPGALGPGERTAARPNWLDLYV